MYQNNVVRIPLEQYQQDHYSTEGSENAAVVVVCVFYGHSITTERFIVVAYVTGDYLYPFGGDVFVESRKSQDICSLTLST
jgi:hypothetical protein